MDSTSSKAKFKRLRVVLLPDEYLPHGTRVHAKMMHELAVHLIAVGHSVIVVTPGLHDQHERLVISWIDGVEVWYFKTPPMRGVGLIRRAITESLLSFRAWLATKEKLSTLDVDICINYSPTIFFGAFAYFLRSKGAYVFLILRDFFPQWLVDQRRLSKVSIIYWYFRAVELFNYIAAHRIALQSPKNKAVFIEKNRAFKDKTSILYNWVARTPHTGVNFKDTDVYLKDGRRKVVFFYGGNMGFAQDIENLIALARRLRHRDDAHFLFIGDGDQVELVSKAAKVLHNISYFPPVPQEVFALILRRIDIGLFTLAREHTAHNFPGKLLGYMQSEVPILGSINPGNDLLTIIEGAQAGIVTVNGDDDALCHAAVKMLDDPSLRRSMGKNASHLRDALFAVEGAAETILQAYRYEGSCQKYFNN